MPKASSLNIPQYSQSLVAKMDSPLSRHLQHNLQIHFWLRSLRSLSSHHPQLSTLPPCALTAMLQLSQLLQSRLDKQQLIFGLDDWVRMQTLK